MDFLKIFSTLSTLFAKLREVNEDGVIELAEVLDVIRVLIDAMGWNAAVSTSREVSASSTITVWPKEK